MSEEFSIFSLLFSYIRTYTAFLRVTGGLRAHTLLAYDAPSAARVTVIVISLGSGALGQPLFYQLQLTAYLPQQNRQLAVHLPGLLELMHQRADRLGPLGVRSEITNLLLSVQSPA
jgi:hypothetical protein